MSRTALILAAALLTGQPALAAGKKEGDQPKPNSQYIDMAPVALPIIVGGRLVNYVFVHARINLLPAADVSKLRAREPYFRDALVRAAHRTPLTMATDYEKVDEPRFKAMLGREAGALAGPGMVRSIELSAQQSLRPVPRPRS